MSQSKTVNEAAEALVAEDRLDAFADMMTDYARVVFRGRSVVERVLPSVGFTREPLPEKCYAHPASLRGVTDVLRPETLSRRNIDVLDVVPTTLRSCQLRVPVASINMPLAYDIRWRTVDPLMAQLSRDLDRSFYAACRGLSGKTQRSGPFSRDALLSILPTGPSGAKLVCGLDNHHRLSDTTPGGCAANRVYDMQYIVTRSSDLLHRCVYFFDEPQYLGAHYVTQDVTVYVTRDSGDLLISAATSRFVALQNSGGVSVVEFS